VSADAQALADLAASVADGTPIDWEAAHAAVGAEQKHLVGHLHLVSSVAELYRSLPPEEAAPGHVEEPNGPRWGPLVVLEALGKGTTAEVHRAWDVALQREVALKLFPPDDGGPHSHGQVLSEARRLARVRHPNVATVYGAERHGDRVGFWMELVDGASLDQLLERHGPYDAREAALIGAEIASALAAVHKAGLLHRDVKAQNVLRESGGRIVLTDFGTGEEVNAQGPSRMAGTPMYLAPEILRGKPASVQSDVYSLGVLVFLLLTGKFPIQARTMVDLARAHAEGHRRRVLDVRPGLPAPLSEVVEQALAESPADRFPTAGAFEEALRQALDTPQRTDTIGAAVESRPRPVQWILLFAAFALLLAVVVWLPWWRTLPPSATPGARVESLAVLPLVDTTGTHGQLADAVTDQLIATLGQLHAVRVTSRASVLPFAKREESPAEVARALGVDAVLAGAIDAERGETGGPRRVRVTATLLAAGTGTELWSGRFDAALGSVGAMQSGIVKSIARGIHLAVAPGEADRLREAARTSPQAEEAYFQGRYYLNQYGVDSSRRAVAALQRATAIEPDYAAAHAALARAYVALTFNGAMTQSDARTRVLASATRALAIDADLAEAHVAIADVRFYYDWDWDAADAAYRRAIDLNPSGVYVRSQYARFLAAAAKLPEALEQVQQAAALDPLSPEAAQTEGLIRYYARDFPGAERALQHAIEIEPNYARAHYVLGRVLEANGQVGAALEATARALALARDPGSSWLAQLSRLHALAGDQDRARAELAALTRGPLRSHPENLGYTYLALGDRAHALRLLEQAADERDASLLWLRVDPRVDPLRGSPEFEALVTRLGHLSP
jgi:serine/threonine-protein kinase